MIKIGLKRQEKIIIRSDQNPHQVAAEFARKHNLDVKLERSLALKLS